MICVDINAVSRTSRSKISVIPINIHLLIEDRENHDEVSKTYMPVPFWQTHPHLKLHNEPAIQDLNCSRFDSRTALCADGASKISNTPTQ